MVNHTKTRRGLPSPLALRRIASLAAMLASPPSISGGIVVDGGTATSVVTAANGRQTVNIAPAVSGVSQNTYTQFNVGAPGAALNNVGINARTIVNQVTSTNPSVISGELAVLGPRANVILANPNGITVDGGSFVNTGHLALSTGQVSFTDVQIAPGIYQRNVNLETRGGTIVVGPQGLTGALIGLDLLARNISIQGPVTNTFSSPTAVTRLTAGDSRAVIDTGLSPTDNGHDWLQMTPPSEPRTAGAYAIDITSAGSLSSGRIELIVNDKGPGVRSAGALNASYGDFVLTSNGSVQISNSAITAANGISAKVQDAITLSNVDARANGGAFSVSASGDIVLAESRVLANDTVTLNGGASVSLQNAGDKTSTLASAGSGVVIKAASDITNQNTLVQGAKGIAAGAVTLVAGGNIVNHTTQGGQMAILFGQDGDVSLTANGNVTNRNARILSNRGVTVTAGGDFSSIVDHIAGVDGGNPVSYSRSSPRWLVLSRRTSGMSVDYGELADPERLSYVTAVTGDVTIRAANIVNRGGSILSNDGAIRMTAADSVTNEAVFTGQASYGRSCLILCRYSAASNVQSFGGMIQAGKDVELSAGSQIENTGGTVLAVGALRLSAPRVIARGVTGYSAFVRGNDMKAWFGNNWATIYRADTGGLYRAGSGQVEIDGEGRIDGGAFMAPNGVHASNGVITIRTPSRTPVTVRNHRGLVSWFGF